jgi:hypothetical protein
VTAASSTDLPTVPTSAPTHGCAKPSKSVAGPENHSFPPLHTKRPNSWSSRSVALQVFRAKRIRFDHLHPATQQRLKFSHQTARKPRWRGTRDVNQQVQVAVFGGFAPRYGAEPPDLADAMPPRDLQDHLPPALDGLI